MAEGKIGIDLYKEFIAQRGIADISAYTLMGAVRHEYARPQKLQYVTINGEKIFVSRIVTNAMGLNLNITIGHENAEKAVKEKQQHYHSRSLSVSGMDQACEDLIAPGLRYCTECLCYCAENLRLTEEQFLPLAQEVDKTFPLLLHYSDITFESFCNKMNVAEQNAQRYKEALDRRTAGVIAAAPKTLHIQGRFEEGFFGDTTFRGTAHVTSAMTQADVIQAYIGNASAANVNREINAAQIQKRAINMLTDYVQEEILKFRDRMLRALSYCAPKDRIYRPTILEESVTARPFTKKSIRNLMIDLDRDEFSKLKIIINYYQIPFFKWFEEKICQDVLDDYIHTGRYNYPYQDLYFLLYMKDIRWPCDHPMIHDLFMDHFKDKIRKKGAALLADKKLRVSKDATVDDYFTDILDEADESEMLQSTYEEDAQLRVVAQEQLDILKKERGPRLFGW